MFDFSLKENDFSLKENDFSLKENHFSLKKNLRYNGKYLRLANHINRYINGNLRKAKVTSKFYYQPFPATKNKNEIGPCSAVSQNSKTTLQNGTTKRYDVAVKVIKVDLCIRLMKNYNLGLVFAIRLTLSP